MNTDMALPEFTTVGALSKRFSMSSDLVKESLEKLLEMDLVFKKGSNYYQTRKWIRLEKSSPLMRQHHSNMRAKAMDSMMMNLDKNLNYSSYITISEKDFSKARELIVNCLKDLQGMVEHSPEETLVGLSMDLFEF